MQIHMHRQKLHRSIDSYSLSPGCTPVLASSQMAPWIWLGLTSGPLEQGGPNEMVGRLLLPLGQKFKEGQCGCANWHTRLVA